MQNALSLSSESYSPTGANDFDPDNKRSCVSWDTNTFKTSIMLTLCLLNALFSLPSSIIKRDWQVSWHGWDHFLVSQSFVANREFEVIWPALHQEHSQRKGKRLPWNISYTRISTPAKPKILIWCWNRCSVISWFFLFVFYLVLASCHLWFPCPLSIYASVVPCVLMTN